MNTSQRVLAYGAAVVGVFVVAVLIGRAVGPIETDDEHGADHGVDQGGERVHLDPAESDHEHGEGAGDATAATYELALEDDVLESGRPQVAFRILDESGEPVTSYDVEHEKRLHLIAVRRDLAEFRHVHPRLDRATGRWSVPIALGAGTWRLYADFAPTGAEPTVAEAELMVAGDFSPQELGPDGLTSQVDGYEVHLERDAAASTVTLHVSKDGADVSDLEPYLGAYGHLVAIRAEDLAYLHVHPEHGEPGPEIAFSTEFDEPGRYRLFLDFKHGGQVRTADFTITVTAPDDHMGDGTSEHEDKSEDKSEDEGGGHDH